MLDLLTDADGRAAGVTLHVMGEGQHDGVGAVRARAVVLATGGMGQVFSATTNPPVSTGDGVALALRAGAEVCDLEFVQFHPTVLWLGPAAEGQQPLISEAVRGEGAHPRRRRRRALHARAARAGRAGAARHRRQGASCGGCRSTGAEHMYLDARHFGAEMWEHRFPTILAACRAHGIDPVTEPIPVAPAAHYASGGVRTDLHGRTTVPGPVRLRRGRLYRGARRQPAGVQLPAGGPGLRGTHRGRHRGRRRPAAGGHPPRRSGATGRAPLLAPEPACVQRHMTAGAGVLRSAAASPRPQPDWTWSGGTPTPRPSPPGAGRRGRGHRG